MKITPERVTRLEPHEVFVVGSNAEGHHGAGAARVAHDSFGAVWARGTVTTGRPTRSTP